jgi:hypothetical protein
MKVFNFSGFLQQKSLNEQVFTDFDSVWDYKKDGDKWLTKKKGANKWIDISDRPEAVNKLNSKYFPDGKVGSDVKKGEQGKKSQVSKPVVKKNILVSDTANPDYIQKLNPDKLDSTRSTKILNIPEQTHCAQFVNDFNQIKKRTSANVGDAWIAKDNSKLGAMVYNIFQGLNANLRTKVIDLWQEIHKRGGGKSLGPGMKSVKSIITELIKSKPFSNSKTPLKLGDVVGIYYPPSEHHEEAFYQAGRDANYFIKKGNEFIPGKTIQSGESWGMNTHLGTVGAIVNNQPMIFHNIGGKVFADPFDKIRDGGKIAWVRRPAQSGTPVKLS